MNEQPTELSTRALADNAVIAANLREYADLLEQQGADGFRIAAYRRAGATLEILDKPAGRILAGNGTKGLIALPGIGRSIAAAIEEMIRTGRWTQLRRLRGTLDPESLFQTLPGIGPDLAARMHDELHAESLEALEIAAWDGRLEDVPGIGQRRLAMLRASLAERLGKRRIRQPLGRPLPSVTTLLDVDHEYSEKAARGALKTIAPRRFNPTGEAWLPVLHTERDDWSFTVLFSNTQRAHELQRTRDWVVVYFHTDSEPEGQCTIVTERTGPLAGKRVVRGREVECRSHYVNTAADAA
jgi:DNA polymerase/3'-5' exonuclease PolX